MVEVAIAIGLGAIFWTFLEYCIHRWAGHAKRFSGNFFEKEHTAHHSRGNYFAPVWKKVAAAGGAVLLLIGPAIWAAGYAVGTGFVAGLVGFFLYYEWYHYRDHVSGGIGPVGRYLRRHHFYHHFHDPRANHGVTTPLWDLVFGTYVKPGRIRVPEKLKMDWLCDPATGEVWDHLQPYYELRRLRRRSAAA